VLALPTKEILAISAPALACSLIELSAAIVNDTIMMEAVVKCSMCGDST
jgi:hypothetical protein